MTLTGDQGSLGTFCYLRDQPSDSHFSSFSRAGMEQQFQLRDTLGVPLTAYHLQTQKGWVMKLPEFESVEVQRRERIGESCLMFGTSSGPSLVVDGGMSSLGLWSPEVADSEGKADVNSLDHLFVSIDVYSNSASVILASAHRGSSPVPNTSLGLKSLLSEIPQA